MAILISVLIFLVCILLVGIILIQNSKGGGLASGFSSSNQIVGVQRTTDFLEKGTWTLAIVLLSLSLLSTAFRGGESVEVRSELEEVIDQEAIAPIQGLEQNTAPLPNQE